MRPPHKIYHLDQTPWVPFGEIQNLGIGYAHYQWGVEARGVLAEMIKTAHQGVPPAIASFLAGLQGEQWPEAPLAEMSDAEFRLGYPPLAGCAHLAKVAAHFIASEGSDVLCDLRQTFDEFVRWGVKDHRGVLDADGRPIVFQFGQGEQGVPVVAPKVLEHYHTLGLVWPIGCALIGLSSMGGGEADHD